MQTIKPSWAIARAISQRHTLISARITLCVALCGLGVLTLIFWLQGETLSLELYRQFFSLYGGLFVWLLFMIHIIPVNWYAIIRVLDYPFKEFHLAIYGHKTDIVNDGEMPTEKKSFL